MRGETRAFNETRWRASHRLPLLVEGVAKGLFTNHDNFFVVRPPEAEGLGDYFVYFDA